jgi:propanol-preferring alcohol dehydrogenase
VVKVAGCGLCHSDVTIPLVPAVYAEQLGWRVPFTLGHEAAGWIHAIGDGVTGFAEGDPVALVSPASCGQCWHCVRGQDSACANGLAGRGYGRDGGLAECVLVESARSLIPLDSLDPVAAGPLTDAGATAYHAVRRALPQVYPGGTVVVIGVGGLGAFAVQFLRLLTSARLVAVDTSSARQQVARELGAAEAIGDAAGLRDVVGSFGADVVLDCVGTNDTIAAGLAALRPGGLPKDGTVFTFQGSSIADVQDVIQLATSGVIRNDVRRFSFAEVEDAYRQLAAGTLNGRAIITMA